MELEEKVKNYRKTICEIQGLLLRISKSSTSKIKGN
jgi:hypothetical protein